MALTGKMKRFCDEYVTDFNATQAAIRAGYSEKTAHVIGWENLRKPNIREEIDILLSDKVINRDEILAIYSERARLDISDYIKGAGKLAWVDVEKLIEDGHGKHIKGVKQTQQGTVVEFFDGQHNLDIMAKHLGIGNKTALEITVKDLRELSDDELIAIASS